MTENNEDSQDVTRTLQFGETAIGHLKANEMPAYPRNYELWYTYVSGLNPALNRAINDLLKNQGRLSENETDKIYEQHLSPQRFSDQVEEISGKMTNHLQSMLKKLDQASSETTAYGKTLEKTSTSITNAPNDAKAIAAAINDLMGETKKMEQRNRELEENLTKSKMQVEELQVSLEIIRHESLSDTLTGLSNRKLFDQSMLRAVEEAEATGKTFSLLLTDVDHFKKFNDNYGHQTGDQVLRLVASVMKQTIKGQDIACRYGGEEFAVILPHTPLEYASRVATNIREAVMGKELIKRSTNERLGHVTISIGISSWKKGDDVQSMIERADAALYQAKRTGRNKVCTEVDLKSGSSAVA